MRIYGVKYASGTAVYNLYILRYLWVFTVHIAAHFSTKILCSNTQIFCCAAVLSVSALQYADCTPRHTLGAINYTQELDVAPIKGPSDFVEIMSFLMPEFVAEERMRVLSSFSACACLLLGK